MTQDDRAHTALTLEDAASSDARGADHAPVTAELGVVAPSKPAAPRSVPPTPVPEPVIVDEADDIAAPNPGPPDSEILPEPRSPFEAAEEPAAAEEPRTPVEALGATAAANASLSARGAPTPLSGVPVVAPSTIAPEVVSFGEPAPDFVPRFAPVSVGAGTRVTPATPGPPSEGLPADLVPEEDYALYRPRIVPGQEQTDADAGEDTDSAGSGDAPDGPPAADPREEPRNPGRALPLILVGLLILGAVAFATYWFALRPAAIELPAQQVVATPDAQVPAVEPIALESPTPFLAAMPTVAGTWALTAAVVGDHFADDALPGRVAELHTLTYEDGTAAVTVDARQLYSEEDALATLRAAAGADADLADATVGTTVVGTRAERSSSENTRIMWTHGSAYFEAVGPTTAVTALVEALGL